MLEDEGVGSMTVPVVVPAAVESVVAAGSESAAEGDEVGWGAPPAVESTVTGGAEDCIGDPVRAEEGSVPEVVERSLLGARGGRGGEEADAEDCSSTTASVGLEPWLSVEGRVEG
jgi:hypothetical protein